MLENEKETKICHKCGRRILSSSAAVRISYENPDKGKYAYINYYHKGCLLQVRSLARKISNIREFDSNNSNHIKTLSWAYFKALFHGNPLHPIFDEKTKAEIVIYDFEKELGFPVEMKLQGLLNFTFE